MSFLLLIMGGSPPGCAYPLDGDGTIPAAFGFGWAGPAVGNGQRVNYARVGGATGGAAVLLAADPFGADSFDLPASGSVAVELQVATAGGAAVGLAVLWHDAGTFENFFADALTADDDSVITVYVDNAGTITWALDGVTQSGSATIPDGSKWAPYIFVNDGEGDSGTASARLVTDSAKMLYPDGSSDLCNFTPSEIPPGTLRLDGGDVLLDDGGDYLLGW